MEREKWFSVKVEYLGENGSPCFAIVRVTAVSKWHAIEKVYSAHHTTQPDRSMYDVYTKKKSDTELAMQRCSHTLAGYAVCYAMTYS